jgi:hypothetical protein
MSVDTRINTRDAHGPATDCGSRAPGHDPGRPAVVLGVVGAGCVVAGGLVAAVTGPLRWSQGSWSAAYLVLVAGVAQYAMGRVPTRSGAAELPAGAGWATLGCWNLGNTAVIVGTLTFHPVLVDVGSLLLVCALSAAWLTLRRVTPTALDRVGRVAGLAYRGMLLALLVGTGIGVLLANTGYRR